MTYDPPLSGIQILDLTSGPMTAVGRLLADLGAVVNPIRLSGVTRDETVGPHIDSVPLATAINRHGMAIAEASADEWPSLLAGADILIEDTRPGSLAERTLAVKEIRATHPSLVILSISDFGRDTRFSSWQATTPVLHALTSQLSRSGIPGREPLVPPGRQLPYHVAAAQAAVVTVSVFLDRLRTGAGDHIDFSVLEGAMQTMDPPFGTAGTASAGVAVSAQRRDWNAEQLRYPIIACKDGYVRICLLAKRQWHGMLEWMGRPEQFTDRSFDSLRVRLSSQQLLAAIKRFCADQTRSELEAEGQRHGVPTAAVLSLSEALRTDQLQQRGFFREVNLGAGLRAPVPVGITEIDGHRASALNAPTVQVQPPHTAPILSGRSRRRKEGLPLEGLRVLDLGVIVVGSDTGRLFGDLGADVVKIENSAFPDGLRGNLTKMSQTYAAGHRNKRSIGIDLRTAEGRGLAHRLVEISDVVLSNFKPGVSTSLGMDHATLSAINPGIVVVESSAFGATGPWAKRMGYGPLVRAAAGVTHMWAYPDEPHTYCDTVTVYPDHVAARIGALAALSLLLRRERTRTGGAVSIAQSEVMISHLADDVAAEVLTSRGHTRRNDVDPDAPWGVFPAAGEDAWIAVTIRDAVDLAALRTVIGERDLAEWTAQHSPVEAMEMLQTAGVPAGAVLHAADAFGWEYYDARRDFREELHPYGAEPFQLENVQIHSERVADPPMRQAPLLGEQTREIARELLTLTDSEIEDLIARGVLEISRP